ncbi:hypothetical protein DL96DRAFT_1556937 [Flagelloscypha sp. PMI_526]|nr:hypothetical protein DL96DRAFT_1556937 [Flagelloscypha sp. PMI_526]
MRFGFVAAAASFLFSAVFVNADYSYSYDPNEVTKIRVEPTHVPWDCHFKSRVGDKLRIDYTGDIYHNGRFFTPYASGVTEFTLGSESLIPGVEEGLVDMCISERRVITISYNQKHRDRDIDLVVPPNSVLVFHAELLAMNKEPWGRPEIERTVYEF